ncbi:outer membrane autotransporter barrel domain-containing protein [Bradyrhizobium sp. NFR13]|uniref:autotransporter outer membrane beta-barrel domain-containing protein n=1 Tax=Bradyrhizobium sp. NFR13 TaxID=1566285 RepID=UPI0008E91093|nr:autotransporter domain-containing protein [Bradyrhizobium sp. NFR13]SFM17274.1 outer membrane autotransporter barrel domain-containing protein [Bradyrhizobium sp. NFR13]
MSARSTISAIGRPRRYLTNASHLALAIGCVVLVGIALPAPAVAIDWTGTTSTDWYTPGNWDLATVPTSVQSVVINTTGPNATLISGGTAVAGTTNIGLNNTGMLTISNGGVLNGGQAFLGNLFGAVGTATVTGPGSIWNAEGMVVGYHGAGALNILNGANVGTSVWEFSLGDHFGGSGAATVDGAGSILTASDFVVGNGGTGTLVVSNGGTVVGTTWTSYIGQAAGSVGTATVTGPGSHLIVANNGLAVGQMGNGTLTIANGGVVSVSGNVIVGFQAGSVGTINIGGGTGAAAVTPGTLDASTIVFGNGAGAINFNHTSTSYTFAPVLDGAGTINQIAGTTILTGDSVNFSGATNVSGGRLAVNGSLAGSIVTVSGGGILGGNGTVGGIVANSGGIIGPGNSIGTLNVNGNVTFAAGSIYQVETNAAGQSDKIAATGSATLNGGTLLVSGAGPIGSQFTILTAAGGINGVFAGAGGTTTSPFLAYGLTYDATNVYLGISRSNLAFAAAGLTRNQIAAGSGADSLPLGSPLVGSLVQLDLPQARRAFDQISGEVHASAKSVMIEDSRFLREAAIDRLRAAFDGIGAAAAPVTTYVNGRPVLAPATTDGVAVWGRGFGSWGQWNGDGNAATVKRDIGGFMAGVDAPFIDGWRVGAIGGYSRSTFRVADRGSSGSSDNYHGGLYGGTQWGDFAFRSGLAYTRHDLSINRSVGFPGVAEMLRGDYSASTTQAFGEFGYRIGAARTPFGPLAFEPFANLAYVNLATDGFTERGGVAALTSRGDNTGVTFTTLGLRASTGVDLGNGMTATARGMLGWRHAFGDVMPTSIMAFAGGSPFTVAGAPIAANAAAADLGFDVNVAPNATLGLTYGGQFGSGMTDQTLRGNFAVRF